MGGKSSASTSTANTQNTNNLQKINTTTTSTEVGAGGVGATGGRDVSVTNITTDQGALKTAQQIAQDSLGTADSVAQAGLDTGRKIGQSSLDFAGEFGNNALALAKSSTSEGLHAALDFGTGVSANEAALAKTAISSTADTETSLFGKASDVLTGAFNQSTSTLGSAITAAGNATRSDTANTLTQVTKYGAIALAVVGVSVVAFLMLRKQ